MAKVEQDGLDVLTRQFSVREAAGLIAKTARWVDRKTFELMPVWYPEFARRKPLFKGNWNAVQTNTSRSTQITLDKYEGNTRANAALTYALGTTKKYRSHWSCCHIWDHGDSKFLSENFVVGDPRFYSCLANMVLLPTPLKAFTDSVPEIKEMLRIVSYHYYGWFCDHESLADWDYLTRHEKPEGYPAEWPCWDVPDRNLPGVVPLNDRIRDKIKARKKRLSEDVEHAGRFYPRESVAMVAKYWDRQLGVNIYG